MKRIFFMLYLVLSSNVFGQHADQEYQNNSITNLVPNPSFEESDAARTKRKLLYEADTVNAVKMKIYGSDTTVYFHNCSYNTDLKSGDYLVNSWYQTTSGTTDFWPSNYCYCEDHVVIPAHSGDGHISFSVAGNVGGWWPLVVVTEYATARLKQPLLAGETYYLEFYVRRDHTKGWTSGNVGALVTKDSTSFKYYRHYIAETPQVFTTDKKKLKDNTQWYKVSGCFKATGGESFITLGSFSPKHQNFAAHSEYSWMGKEAYYHIDDVLLVEDSKRSSIPTPEENIVVLIDMSESMKKGNYLESLKTDLRNYVQDIGKNAWISIITFDSKPHVIARHQKISVGNVLDSLLSQQPFGITTHIKPAITTAYDLVDSLTKPGVPNKVILLTDGAFDFDKDMEKKLNEGMKKNGTEFILYHYGDYENKELIKSISKNKGFYFTSGSKNFSDAIANRSECNCK